MASREGRYNAAGNRNFVVFLDNERASELESQGWNIHWYLHKTEELEEEKKNG